MARTRIIRQAGGLVTPLRPPPPPPQPIPPPVAPVRRSQDEVHYPDSDGHFLCDNITHSQELIYAYNAVGQHLRGGRNTVLIDVFLYYREGDNRASVGPDLLVTLDHETKGSDSYKTWVEGRLPDFVLEVVSPSSVENDKKLKKGIYERLGIREYFLYDPDREQSGTPVRGYRLRDGAETYGRALRAEADGSVVSLALGISLRREDSKLIVRNTKTGEDYLRVGEWQEHVDQIQSEKEVAWVRANQAEARADTEKVRADTEKVRTDQATVRADTEKVRADQATVRADTEKARAAQARVRAARYKAGMEARELEILRLKEQLAARE